MVIADGYKNIMHVNCYSRNYGTTLPARVYYRHAIVHLVGVYNLSCVKLNRADMLLTLSIIVVWITPFMPVVKVLLDLPLVHFHHLIIFSSKA